MAFDNIHNYFEKLVFDEIQNKLSKNEFNHLENYISDIACVALNQLPARYVHHDVDMAFYMTIDERENNITKVNDAVSMAIDYVQQRNDSKKT